MKDLNEFIKEFGSEDDFKANAFYDKHLDCIRVRTRDCSVIEERLSHIFTMLKSAHSGQDNFVGFTIKGVRHLFEELGMDPKGVFRLTDIINAIVGKYPDQVVKEVREAFVSVEGYKEIEVELKELATA